MTRGMFCRSIIGEQRSQKTGVRRQASGVEEGYEIGDLGCG
jgi:hypothetical protein